MGQNILALPALFAGCFHNTADESATIPVNAWNEVCKSIGNAIEINGMFTEVTSRAEGISHDGDCTVYGTLKEDQIFKTSSYKVKFPAGDRVEITVSKADSDLSKCNSDNVLPFINRLNTDQVLKSLSVDAGDSYRTCLSRFDEMVIQETDNDIEYNSDFTCMKDHPIRFYQTPLNQMVADCTVRAMNFHGIQMPDGMRVERIGAEDCSVSLSKEHPAVVSVNMQSVQTFTKGKLAGVPEKNHLQEVSITTTVQKLSDIDSSTVRIQ